MAKGTLFLGAMMWTHAERSIVEGCEDSKRMSDKQLAAMRAAHGLKPVSKKGREARTELAEHLLAGKTRCDVDAYNLQLALEG